MELSKYYCKFCDYKTDKRQYWYAHVKGKKHHKNVKFNQGSIEGLTPESTGLSNPEPNILGSKVQNGVQPKQGPFICNYCQVSISTKSHLTRHYKTCKMKKEIIKSGLYCMWNEKMKDDLGNSYYKLGRTSSRELRISSYASEYGIKRKDVKFLYEVEFEDEVFAERFLFYLLDEFRIFKTKELFKINLETIKKTMNQLNQILDETPKIKNQGMVLENFDLLMNEDVDNIED